MSARSVVEPCLIKSKARPVRGWCVPVLDRDGRRSARLGAGDQLSVDVGASVDVNDLYAVFVLDDRIDDPVIAAASSL